MAKIKNETLITIKNNTGGGVSYKNEMNILRRWERPNSIRKLQFLELQQSISQSGVYNMFAEGLLLIDENNAQEIMDMLGIPELDDYVCTIDEINELLDGSDYDDLANVLKWGSQLQTDSIISIVTNKKIKDANVVQIIKDVTGVDVTISPVDKKVKGNDEKKPPRSKASQEEVVEEKPARKAKVAKSTTKKTDEK